MQHPAIHLLLLAFTAVRLDSLIIPRPISTRIRFSNKHPVRSVEVNPIEKRSRPTLFSTPDDGLSPRNFAKKLLQICRKTIVRMISLPLEASKRFSKLSRKAKSIVAMQGLVFALVFGVLGRRVYVNQIQYGSRSAGPAVEVPYSNFLNLVEESGSKGSNTMEVDNVRIGGDRIMYQLTKVAREGEEGEQRITAYTRKVPASSELITQLRTNKIAFTAATQPRTTSSIAIVARTAILGFYMLILWRMYKTFSSNSGSGDVPGKLASTSSSLPLASFNDIQGIDEAKAEVVELVDALMFPEKYAMLGARAPKGLLLEGPPGTGKTLLARATAATAGVPLLYCSGSDFVEMFVGRGAARVRKLFERASRLAPCIIFVDELDALGKTRDMGGAFSGGRGNDEAEQTLNQLLSCMDGLDSTRRICVLAATNRKDILDNALIRPGRFDRIVSLSLPNTKGRENILRVHAQKLPGFEEGKGIDPQRANSLGVGAKVDLSAVAAATSGFSGAELEFLVNEAAIRAVRRVSSALRNGDSFVAPNVTAADFESSLENFFSTRKPKSNVNDLWKNVWQS